MGITCKCHFPPRFPNESPKIGIRVVPKLQTFISFSNQVYFENMKAISYSPQKDFSTCITCTDDNSLDPYFQGFVVESQIPNLTIALFKNHNSCKSCLNEQCEGTLSICASRPFGSNWCLFAFPTKALNIRNFSTNATPKVGMHLGVIGFHPLHSPPFLKVCFTPKQIFLASWAFVLHV